MSYNTILNIRVQTENDRTNKNNENKTTTL